MAEQNNISNFGTRKTLNENGKIKWKPSRNNKKSSKIKKYDINTLILFIIIILLSIFFENYYNKYGSIILIIGILFTGLYSIRSIPHDNIPMGTGYLPFFGHAFNALSVFDRFFDAEVDEFNLLKDKNRKYYSASMPMNKNYVFIAEPKLIDYIFRLQFSDAYKGIEYNECLKPMLGNGIFATDGQIWKKHRSIASKMFTIRSLRDYMFAVFIDTTNILMDKMDDIISSNDSIIDMYDMFNRLTLEAFTQVAFGVKLDVIKSAPDELPFAHSFDRGFRICTIRFFDTLWKIKQKFNIGIEKELKEHEKIINEFIDNVIKMKKEQQSQYKLSKQFDLITLFLENDPNITNQELRDVTMNFIIAGKDTTAQLLSWFLYEITKNENKSIKDNILKEINECSNIENDVDYDNISKLTYLENSFLETLRLRPSVPHLVRQANVDIPIPNTKHIIRKHDTIIVPTYAMGRMDFIWDKPLIFDPNRFKNESYSPSKFPAFNIKPRLCLGKHVALLEAKIAIYKLFKKYEFIPVKDQEITYIYSVTNQMKNGFKLKVIKL